MEDLLEKIKHLEKETVRDSEKVENFNTQLNIAVQDLEKIQLMNKQRLEMSQVSCA